MSSTGIAQVGTPSGNKAVEYIRLCNDHIYRGDEAYSCGYVVTENAKCERCGDAIGPYVFEAQANDPRLAGWGPPLARASVALDPVPRFIWDVNRYYRRLGVDPRACKREIREAYQRLDGDNSPELTSIVKFLLDDNERWRYDNLPIGRINVDEQIMHHIRVAESQRASDMILSGEGDAAQFQRLYAGLREPDDPVVDGELEMDDDEPPTRRQGSWNWGHYTWRSGSENFSWLAQWQGALAAAIAEREGGIDFAVGFLGHADVPWEVRVVGYRIVAFLNDRQQPTTELAAGAASRVVQLSKETRSNGRTQLP